MGNNYNFYPNDEKQCYNKCGYQVWNTYEGLGVTTGKDIILTPDDVARAKEALSRIEKTLFYRFGRYIGSKLGS